MGKVTPLKLAIVASGMGTYEIASKMGIDGSVVSRWASGDRAPKVHQAQELARILDTTVDALWPTERAAA